MSDEEFADWLRSRRTLTEEQVGRREHLRDAERGPYAPHGQTTHHVHGESRQA